MYFHKPAVKKGLEEQAGVIKLGEVLKAHPSYQNLLQLYGERAVIAFQIKSMSESKNSLVPLEGMSDDDMAAFASLSQQKNDMAVRLLNSKLQNEMIDKEKELRAQIADEKDAEVKRESDKYENAIFNCSLKLDNADNLRLTPDDINALQVEMNRLKAQRAARIKEVVARYESYVQSQLGQYYNERQQYFQSIAAQKVSENNAKMNEKQAQFASKKNDMAAAQNDKLNQRKNYFALLKKYSDKNMEINSLRRSMIDDISIKASMAAVRYHLNIIYAEADDSSDLLSTDDDWGRVFDGQMVVSSSVQDVTDDVIQQMQDDKTAGR